MELNKQTKKIYFLIFRKMRFLFKRGVCKDIQNGIVLSRKEEAYCTLGWVDIRVRTVARVPLNVVVFL
jgi:hypothetical protein